MSSPSESKIDPLLAQILPWAKAAAVAEGAERLDMGHLLVGALKVEEGQRLLAGLLRSDLLLNPEAIAASFGPELEAVKTPVADRAFKLEDRLQRVADEEWTRHAILRAEPLLKKVLAAAEEIPRVKRLVEAAKGKPSGGSRRAPKVFLEVLEQVSALRVALMDRVVGQGRAIDRVADAYFNILLRERAPHPSGPGNRGPRAIFTFVGPPGVGKTYLAELFAEHVAGKGGDAPPFLRLDMTGYSTHQAHEQLLGFSTAYRGASGGILSGFIHKNPEGFVLVDEVEKAHRNTQNIFLQILDGGRLYDNHTRTDVDFSRATLIFTTNLGRDLYDAPNRAGILQESGGLNAVVLDALQAEGRMDDGERPGFTPELVSRLSKGEAVLFQRLDGLALERLADRTVDAFSKELRAASDLAIEVEERIGLTLLLLRFGVEGDARRLQAGLRRFLSETVAEVLNDHRSRLIEGEAPLSATLEGLRLAAPSRAQLPGPVVARLEGETHLLLIDDDDWSALFAPPFVCHRVESRAEADEVLRRQPVDFILLDLHIGAPRESRDREAGLEMLRWLRGRYPEIPVYLFSESPERRGLSIELLERISVEGGARGVLGKEFVADGGDDAARDAFFRRLREIDGALRRQGLVDHYRRRVKVLDFDLRPNLDRIDDGWLPLEMRQIREVTAVSAADRRGPGWVDLPQERFTDIAGGDHAKQRLQEVVQWIKEPGRLRDLGLDLPKGILLTGPPGTGKTTLARAVAGEAEVPFFAISGSQVFNKWAGESEATVRDLFARARRYAPAIIFIDEIDSVGVRRDGGSDRAGQTRVLNELLTQLDGFSGQDSPLFVLAATNRPDILDPALVRAGRFDLQIEVPNPNSEARETILQIHLRAIPCAGDLDLSKIAARTGGFSGAELQQVCKEAGFLALRQGVAEVSQLHLEEAVTDIRHGLASERVTLGEATRRSVAVHEAGHAVAQWLLLPDEPLTQVTILPRGQALGFAEFSLGGTYLGDPFPRLRSHVRCYLAGRVAEELLLGLDHISAGCANDLRQASRIALLTVSRYGFHDQFGLLSLPGAKLGLGLAGGAHVAMAVQEEAIATARTWLAQQKDETARLLTEHRATLEKLAHLIVERETLYGDELARFFTDNGLPPQQKEK